MLNSDPRETRTKEGSPVIALRISRKCSLSPTTRNGVTSEAWIFPGLCNQFRHHEMTVPHKAEFQKGESSVWSHKSSWGLPEWLINTNEHING